MKGIIYDEEHFDPIMYKHALHDYNSYDVKATPNHTHHLRWPHPLPGLTTSELPEPPLIIHKCVFEISARMLFCDF